MHKDFNCEHLRQVPLVSIARTWWDKHAAHTALQKSRVFQQGFQRVPAPDQRHTFAVAVHDRLPVEGQRLFRQIEHVLIIVAVPVYCLVVRLRRQEDRRPGGGHHHVQPLFRSIVVRHLRRIAPVVPADAGVLHALGVVDLLVIRDAGDPAGMQRPAVIHHQVEV